MRFDSSTVFSAIALFVASMFGVACAPAIGDECSSSVDCSVNGDRICDTAQPGGYCTIPSCEANTCPDDSRCVEFRYSDSRNASTWCMASCSGSGDCRGDEGYSCVHASDLEEGIARVVDSDDGRFCAQTAP